MFSVYVDCSQCGLSCAREYTAFSVAAEDVRALEHENHTSNGTLVYKQ